MVHIITGTTNKPMASEQLKTFFSSRKDLNGYLYIGYPIIGTIEGAYPIDAIWISPEKGLVIFNLIEGKEITEDYVDFQDDCANKMEAKLKGYRELMQKRRLCVEIHVITFAPTVQNLHPFDEDYPLCNEEILGEVINDLSWKDSEYYNKLVSVLQAISTVRKGKKKREVNEPTSRGAKLRNLEDSIANLDNRQNKAVIETVEGVQRIRGLAGSGKTIVLALKAAYLHAQHPEWKIAITFNSRALKGQIRQLINTFYIEQTNEEPDWENIQIIHAWGAPGGGERNGMYYKFCSMNNVTYSDYSTARRHYGTKDPFGEACGKALSEATSTESFFDVILVDEAQDFSPNFLKICYELLKEPKRLVYAYDELQNLRSESLPSPEEIFGVDQTGIPRVKFDPSEEGKPQQDIILEKCYRNSRPTLVTAHALGFGIYRQPIEKSKSGLVQMFDNNSLWNDIGYEVLNGNLVEGEDVVLKRTAESSPEFLEKHSSIDDLIIFQSFKTQEEQDKWVADEIERNLKTDELRSDDIMVINPDPLTTKKSIAPIRTNLYHKKIKTHLAGVDTNPDVFFENENDSVAFTGIFRAKGNEAAMIYVVNAESCFAPFDIAKSRNQLFTAITRSKAWVRVLGVGKDMDDLISEYQSVKKNDFSLKFTYPTESQRNEMKIVNRDMSEAEKNKVKKGKLSFKSLLNDLDNGQLHPADLSPEDRRRFMEYLNSEV